ncbi:MAG: hypothetical protein U0T36_06195 [Saprospiraceae bacterium]
MGEGNVAFAPQVQRGAISEVKTLVIAKVLLRKKEWNNRWELSDTISPLNLKRFIGKESIEDMNLKFLIEKTVFKMYSVRYFITIIIALKSILLFSQDLPPKQAYPYDVKQIHSGHSLTDPLFYPHWPGQYVNLMTTLRGNWAGDDIGKSTIQAHL